MVQTPEGARELVQLPPAPGNPPGKLNGDDKDPFKEVARKFPVFVTLKTFVVPMFIAVLSKAKVDADVIVKFAGNTTAILIC